MDDHEQQNQETDDMEEYLSLSTLADQFHIKLKTLRTWVNLKKLPTRKQTSELGVEYHVAKPSEVRKLLQNRSKVGRPLGRT